MAKGHFPISLPGWGTVLAIVLIVAGLHGAAHGQSGDVALLLHQTPSQGGTITPRPGVHHFAQNAQVILTAVPKPGYAFICWLGDVSDPTSSLTITYLDKPKIIIAVFQQIESDTLLTTGSTSGGVFSAGGDMINSPADFGWPRHSRVPAGRPKTPAAQYAEADEPIPGPGPAVPPEPPILEPPVPDPPTPPLPPVPEPVTGMLLALGGLSAFARHRARTRT